MNINQTIEEALKDVTEDIWFLCCPREQPPDAYIVYNPELEEPGYYADDEDQDWIASMQIHLFAKGNYFAMKKEIIEKLRKAGFILMDIQSLYEKDSGFFHVIFSCWKEEE